MSRIPAPERRDVPRLLRDLYPHARRRGRLHVLAPGEVVLDDRPMRRWRRALYAFVAIAIAIPLLVLSRGEAGATTGATLSGGIMRRLFRVQPSWALWERWSRARGGVRAAALPDHPLLSSAVVERGRDQAPSYELVAGERRIGVHVTSVEVRSEHATHHGAYVALVALPDAVAARFPASSYVRRSGHGLTDLQRTIGERLELESIRMVDDARLHVSGGDPIDWRALMDPALVDLLAEGIHVEWIQRGTQLLLHSPAPMDSVWRPEAARLDAMVVAAVAIERRLATIAGDGVAVPAVESASRTARRDAAIDRHLARARQDDLAMSIEDQFVELAKYTTADEVELVRRRIDEGAFRVDHLDDLIHHRRAQMWGAATDEDAA